MNLTHCAHFFSGLQFYDYLILNENISEILANDMPIIFDVDFALLLCFKSLLVQLDHQSVFVDFL